MFKQGAAEYPWDFVRIIRLPGGATATFTVFCIWVYRYWGNEENRWNQNLSPDTNFYFGGTLPEFVVCESGWYCACEPESVTRKRCLYAQSPRS